MKTTHRALALFSGGLDSILATKLIQKQGLEVTCLHFVSPFFGHPALIPQWEETYGVRIQKVDVSESYVNMLRHGPIHGFGSALNPCIDCKILMLRKAKELLHEMGACCIITGEVLGQRPMSQRRDTLNVIRRDADLKGLLLRPLCAQHMEPTEAELAGYIDRSRLLGISGRSRKQQFELAAQMGLQALPTPAGGCLLTEQESSKGYIPVLKYVPNCTADDFSLSDAGRQLWAFSEKQLPLRLLIGRNQADNDKLMALARPQDILLKVRDFTGPIALCRFTGRKWSEAEVNDAASLTASYATKALRFYAEQGGSIAVRVHYENLDTEGHIVEIVPSRTTVLSWREYTWQEAEDSFKAKQQ